MVGYNSLAPQIRFVAGVLAAHECPVKMFGVLAEGSAVDSDMIPEMFLCCLVPVAGALI